MSDLNPEFKLADLDLHKGQMFNIEHARKETIPKPEKLERLREQADHRGVLEIDENELAMEFKRRKEFFRLEHGQTTAVVGGVWRGSFGYHLLWFIDGRTIETVCPSRSEYTSIYADGIEIGSFEVIEKRRRFLFFKAQCAWAIRIGDREIIRMNKMRKLQTRISIQMPGKQPFETWIGFAKAPTLKDSLFRLLHKTRLRKSVHPNTRWFLPRDELDNPIAHTLEERIAFTAFSLLKRSPVNEDIAGGGLGDSL